LIACTALGNLETVHNMVDVLGVDVNSKDNNGNNALMASCGFMYADIIKKFW
jgi:hypothetical protein